MMTAPATPLAIPTTLHASLLERLDRLAPTREVAQIGAALGRSFSHELISAVAQMPQHSLDDALEQLVNAELIFRRGMPPDAEYTFKHALVQDAAYSTLLRSRRQQIHGRIATTLENQFPDLAAAQPQLLAQHCAEAGLNEKAVGYLLKAGQQAYVRSAMTEAMAQFQKGLDLLPSLPDDRGRQQHELDLQIGIGQALLATKVIRRRLWRGLWASPRAGRAARSTRLSRAAALWLIYFTPCAGRVEGGAGACRGVGELRKGARQFIRITFGQRGTWNDLFLARGTYYRPCAL